MGRRPIANGVTLRVCTAHEGRHLAIVLSRRADSHTVHPFDASMLRPHERHAASADILVLSMQPCFILNVLGTTAS